MNFARLPATAGAGSIEGTDEGTSDESDESGEDDAAMLGASTCMITMT